MNVDSKAEDEAIYWRRAGRCCSLGFGREVERPRERSARRPEGSRSATAPATASSSVSAEEWRRSAAASWAGENRSTWFTKHAARRRCPEDPHPLRLLRRQASRLRTRPDAVEALYVSAAEARRAAARPRRSRRSRTRCGPYGGRRSPHRTRRPARHQGVVAIVDAGCRTSRSTTSSSSGRAAAPRRARRRHRSAQPRRVHARPPCVRRAAVVAPKDRAVGLNATVARAAQRRRRDVPLSVTNLARTFARS